VLYRGEIHDTGKGWDAKHQNVDPGDWLDIWLADPSKWATGWYDVEIELNDCE
jgi:hypothetical protein